MRVLICAISYIALCFTSVQFQLKKYSERIMYNEWLQVFYTLFFPFVCQFSPHTMFPFFSTTKQIEIFHFQCLQLSNLLKCDRCVSQALICGESLTWFCHISTPQRFCHISTPELSSPALSEPLPVSLLAAEHAICGPGGEVLVDDDHHIIWVLAFVFVFVFVFAFVLYTMNLPTRLCSRPRSLLRLRKKLKSTGR